MHSPFFSFVPSLLILHREGAASAKLAGDLIVKIGRGSNNGQSGRPFVSRGYRWQRGLSLFFFSHPSRHRAHGQELDVGVWVFGTRPEAIHGRLWRHPLHEQCQTLPLPGKKHSSFDQIVSFSTEMFQCFLFLVNILTSGKFMGYSNETGKFGLPNFQNNVNLLIV